MAATTQPIDLVVREVAEGSPTAVRALLLRIRREHEAKETATLVALARRDDPAIWRAILGYLGGEVWRGQPFSVTRSGITGELRSAITRPYGQTMERRRATVRDAMRDPEARLRALGATLAAELRDREATPLAVALLSDTHPEVRIAAARLLQVVPDSTAVEALMRNMEESDYGVRSSAVAAMRALGRAALPGLLRRLIARPCSGAFKTAAEHAIHWVGAGADATLLGEVAAALRGPAVNVVVPVAADRLLNWYRQNGTAPSANA